MPTFTIAASLYLEMPTDGADRRKALQAFLRSYPNCVVAAVDGQRVIGFCRKTGLPIFNDDTYQTGHDGN